ncbi:YbbR-like domain-containing protein, partial [Paenibacillus sp. MCAF20]
EPTVVRIDVQGKLTDLLSASSIDDYKVIVDVKDVKPGIQELPLVVKLPKGIQLVAMSPRTVTVQLEEIVTKTFDLQVVAEGKPAEGFVAGEPAAVTLSTEAAGPGIEVTLPKDDMQRVGSVVASVNIEGADKTVTDKKAKVVVYDTDGLE